MDAEFFYCTNCGTANEKGAKFCYKCGSPVKTPQSTEQLQPVSDFITLSCPKCGGQLEITPDMDRFSCKYCGNEHLVRRSGGNISLAPVVEGVKRVEEKFDRALIGADRMAAEQTIQRLKNELVGLERQFELDQVQLNLIQSQFVVKPGKGLMNFGIIAIILAFVIPFLVGITHIPDGQYSLLATLLLFPIGIICTIIGARRNRKITVEMRTGDREKRMNEARAVLQHTQTMIEDHKKRLDDLHRYTTER